MKSSPKTTKQISVFCGVLIKDGKVLMIQRSEEECPKAHLKWEFPGGKVDFGENPRQALKREFFEETGVNIRVKDFLSFVHVSYWDYGWGRQQVLSFAFNCEFISQKVQVKKDHHVEKIEWVDINKVKRLKSLPGVMKMLEESLVVIKK